MRRPVRWLIRGGLAVLLAVVLVLLLVPREPVVTAVTFDGASIAKDIDAYLVGVESGFDDITPGVEKRVIWANGAGVRTDRVIVYLHGFSATSEEIRPVPDLVAADLGANLVYTRLAGHGRTSQAMAEPRVADWMNDVAEALEVARRIGDRIIIIATSTGGTLAAVAAQDPQLSQGVEALVLISPNFGLAAPASVLLSLPGVRWWAALIAGAERNLTPLNADHAKYWTTSYPTVALVPMAALVRYARGLDYSGVTTPALFLFSDGDRVVNEKQTRRLAARWGGPVTLNPIDVPSGNDPFSHVIAGDILSPGLTDPVHRIASDWIAKLP